MSGFLRNHPALSAVIAAVVLVLVVASFPIVPETKEVVVVHELPLPALFCLEVKRTPGDERRLVRQAREVEVRFGVKLRHAAAYARSAYF